jgi:glycosyltransferase involved in cell wall biosynthesis
MEGQYLISIIVPCYNQAKYLSETLDSVLAQTNIHWQCVIVNDGSTDNTEEIACAYCRKDPRFTYLCQNNEGLSSARNMGIRSSTGRYILPLDADDLIHPDYTREAVKLLDENDDIKLVYAHAEFFGCEQGHWDLPDFIIERLALENTIYCSAIYRRRDYEQTDGYSTDMIHGMEDWDFWLRILKDGGKVYRIPETYFFYRKKDQSMIKELNADKIALMQAKVYAHHQAFYDATFGNPISLLHQIKAHKIEIQELRRQLRLVKNSRLWRIRRFFGGK